MADTLKKILIAAAIVFLLSGVLITLGALSKLQHWPMAGPLLISGTLLNVLSYVLGIVGLVMYLRKK